MRRSRFTSTRRSIEPRQLLLCDCLIKSSCSLFLSIHLSHSITSYCCFLYGLPLLEASSYLFDFLLKYSLRNPQSLCLTRSYLEHQWTLQSTEVVCRLCGSRSLMVIPQVEKKPIKLEPFVSRTVVDQSCGLPKDSDATFKQLETNGHWKLKLTGQNRVKRFRSP